MYPTAVGIEDDGDYGTEGEDEEGKQPSEVQNAVKHYQRDYARVDLHQNESVSELNLEQLRIPDFDQYFRDYYAEQLELGAIKALPEFLNEEIVEYRDQMVSIDTAAEHTVLLYVPQLYFTQFFTSKTKESRYLEKLIYECLPSL